MQRDGDILEAFVPTRWIVAAGGIGCFIAWIFSMFFGDAMSAIHATSTSVGNETMRATGLLVFAAAMVMGTIFSRFLARFLQKRFILALLAIGAALPAYGLLTTCCVGYVPTIVLSGWVLEGIAAAGMVFIWSAICCRIPRSMIVVVFSIAFVFAGTLFVVVCKLPHPMNTVMSYLLQALSVMSFVVLCRERGRREDDHSGKGQLKVVFSTSVMLVVVGASLGFCLYQVGNEYFEISVYLIGAGLVFGALFAALLKRHSDDTLLLLSPIMRYICPVLIVGFLLEPFLSGVGRIVCLEIMIVAAFCGWLSLNVNSALLACCYAVDPHHHWMRTSSPWIVGLAVGLIVGSSSMNGTLESVFSFPVEFVFATALAVAIVIAPFEADVLTAPRTFFGNADHGLINGQIKPWCAACRVLEDDHGLTERERDVFEHLARGRSHQVIARELNISVHTVKTHIGNIYRKLDVCAQQDLIDLVEEQAKANRLGKIEIQKGRRKFKRRGIECDDKEEEIAKRVRVHSSTGRMP